MCSKTPLNPRLFTAVLPKRLYILLHIHHAFMIIFETSHTGLIMASLNVLGKLLPSSRTLSPFPLFLHWRSPLPFCVLFLFPASSKSWATLAVSNLVLQPRFYIGCHLFDSWFNIRSGHMYFQGQYFLYFSPFVCSIFLAIFIALVVFVFNSFLFILFLQPLPGFQSY